MGFASGTVTFKRFTVQGQLLDNADEGLLEKLAAHAINADALQTMDQTFYGWTTGEHILDTRFDLAKNFVADGLHFALRIDTNKPPADLVRSYQAMHEQAILEAAGKDFLSKVERREARRQAIDQADAEARAGAFRRMKQVPVFWDLKRGEVYLGSAASTTVEHFMTLFDATFERSLMPLGSGELAARWANRSGAVSAFDDCEPAHFVNPPEGGEAREEQIANLNEAGSRDFLGSEWLMWLWYASHVETPDVANARGQSVTVLFEKTLQLECAFRMSGSMALSAESPTRLPEAQVALVGGKRPVRAGLQVAVGGNVFGVAIRGDAMNFSGIKLPPPEDPKNPQAIFEERIEYIRDLIDGMDALYAAYLKRRLSPRKWPTTLNAMRNWIATGNSVRLAPAEMTVAS